MLFNSTIEKDFTYEILVSAEVILIKHSSYSKLLLLEPSGSNLCLEIEDNILSTLSFKDKRLAHSVLGVLKVDQFNILLYVSESEFVGTIKESKIFRIKEVGFLPICNEVLFANSKQETKDSINGIRNMLTTGFYYSFDYDLSNSFNKQPNDKNFAPNINYYWNYAISKVFIQNNISPIFMTIVICGYVGVSNPIDLSSLNVNLYLISRRNTNMPGTKHNCKGIDEFGNSANFLETEQILQANKRIFTFLIYRGHPMVFYKKNKHETKLILIDKPDDLYENSIIKHIEAITSSNNQNIFVLNLLSDYSTPEIEISQHFKCDLLPNKTLKKKMIQYLKYECKADIESKDYIKVESFINNMLENDHFMNTIQYYLEDNKKVCMMQKGVFRVNCFNSLDRTNIMQTAICWKIIENQVSIYVNNI